MDLARVSPPRPLTIEWLRLGDLNGPREEGTEDEREGCQRMMKEREKGDARSHGKLSERATHRGRDQTVVSNCMNGSKKGIIHLFTA